jgi:short-subunit dehydrogenase
MGVRSAAFGLGIAIGAAGALLLRHNSSASFKGKHVFITGGSRGLGLVLAREFLCRGAKVTIAARDADELERAETQLRMLGNDVLSLAVDMTMREEAEDAIHKAEATVGPVDVLVNNAGTICVGPEETMTIDDFRDSINTHFWGPYFTIAAVLPTMRSRRKGRIVNISSIGGKISIPHLLPYSVGKFALTGYSEGLRSELLQHNIFVTTVCPGLMRTGSPRNALFKGENEKEYAWFIVSDSLPMVSMSAKRAARQIIEASSRGESEVVLSLPAKLAVKVHGILPGMTANLLSAINRVLPRPHGIGTGARTGAQSDSSLKPGWITKLTDEAAIENNEI